MVTPRKRPSVNTSGMSAGCRCQGRPDKESFLWPPIDNPIAHRCWTRCRAANRRVPNKYYMYTHNPIHRSRCKHRSRRHRIETCLIRVDHAIIISNQNPVAYERGVVVFVVVASCESERNENNCQSGQEWGTVAHGGVDFGAKIVNNFVMGKLLCFN